MAFSRLLDSVHTQIKRWGGGQFDDAQTTALIQKTLTPADFARLDVDVSTMTTNEANALASDYVRRITADPRTDRLRR